MALAILGMCASADAVGQKRVRKMAEPAQIHGEERTGSKHLLDMSEWCVTGGPLTLIFYSFSVFFKELLITMSITRPVTLKIWVF